jgi:hypothetical protein
VLAGAFASAATAQSAPADWGDIEGRIQYAYYTNDSRALNSLLTSLELKGGESEGKSGDDDAAARHYFRALTHYRAGHGGGQEIPCQGSHRRMRR